MVRRLVLLLEEIEDVAGGLVCSGERQAWGAAT